MTRCRHSDPCPRTSCGGRWPSNRLTPTSDWVRWTSAHQTVKSQGLILLRWSRHRPQSTPRGRGSSGRRASMAWPACQATWGACHSTAGTVAARVAAALITVTEGGAAAAAVHIGFPFLGLLVSHLARQAIHWCCAGVWLGPRHLFLLHADLCTLGLVAFCSSSSPSFPLADDIIGRPLCWCGVVGVLFFQIYRWLWSTAWGMAWVWSIAVTFPFWLSARVCGVALGGVSEACVLLLFSFRFSQIAAAGHRAPKWSVIVFVKSYCATHARNPPWAVYRSKKLKTQRSGQICLFFFFFFCFFGGNGKSCVFQLRG